VAHKAFQYFLALPVLIAVLMAPAGWAQLTSQAQLAGLVTDKTGASVPEAAIKATNTATNVEYPAVSNVAGAYIILDLVPGPYKVTVSKTGFKTTVQTGVVLKSGDRLSLNFALEVGELKTTLEVTAKGELLSTEDASYSFTMDNQMITTLPQISRATLDQVAAWSPAIEGGSPATLSTDNYFVDIGSAGNTMAVAGGQVNGAMITVDGVGVQDMEDNNASRSIPTPDAVNQFRVQTGLLTADVSRYSGGVIDIASQSGTKDYHGRLFYYGRDQDLNSNGWSNNALDVAKTPFHQDNYGLALGGPLSIPKVYNGKERTFFFFNWEAEHFSTSSFAQANVPTAMERQGDFSQSIINYVNGQPVYAQIFDPFEGYYDTQGNWVRPEYPNATIPKDKQVALWPYFMQLYDMPNHAPDANTSSTNDYWGFVNRLRGVNQETLRVDHNLTANQRFFARVSRYRGNDDTPALLSQGEATDLYDNDWQGSLGYTWSISSSVILDARLGTSVNKFMSYDGSAGSPSIDTTMWPVDPMVFQPGTRSNPHIAPNFDPAGYTPVGGGEFDQFTHQTYNATISLTKVWNRHTFKIGYDGLWAVTNESGGDKSGNTYIWSGGGTNQYWNNNDGMTGQALAALMLGSSQWFNWGNWVIAPMGPLHGAYVMDDWKVNTKLTLQLGLRYDYERGRKPRYCCGLAFDTTAKNVRTPNADWSWNQVLGAVPEMANYASPTWLSSGINGETCLIDTPQCPQHLLYNTTNGTWQPRIGVSYALDSNTVLHASFGSVFQSLSGFESKIGGNFYYPWDTYNQVPTIDGMHWVSELGLDHGLGTFPLQPGGSHLGYVPKITDNQQFWYATLGGMSDPSYGFTPPETPYKMPLDIVWGLSIQRRVGNSWVASAEYQGIHGVNLMMPFSGYDYTNIDPKYYSLGSQLYTPVPNPFFGQSEADASAPEIPLYRLLAQMPQYSFASPGMLTAGHSMSNFLNLQMNSRNFHGLMLQASYNIRKTELNTNGKDFRLSGEPGVFQNPNNLNEAYGVAPYELPQTWCFEYTYELPVGRGKRFLGNSQGWAGRLLNATVGGWGLAGVTDFWPKGSPVPAPGVDGSVGAPNEGIRWSASSSNWKNSGVDYGRDLIVSGSFVNPNPSVVFNKSVFVRTPDYSFGNLPYMFPNVRNPGGFSTDGTTYKNFYFSEDRQRYVNVRVEATNFFNHPNFGGVNNDPDSPTFGGIYGKSGNRVMQIGLRLFF
jgi:hypothetical protein